MKKGVADNRFRGHLPPPFYNGREDYSRVGYLSEPRPVPAEDQIFAGQVAAPKRAWEYHRGDSDYRHYGDRRRSDDPERSWTTEHQYRGGYRTIAERMRMQAGNRGKGPRSYKRSDDRILEDLNRRLYEDPFLDASDIETRVAGGEVTLIGTVEDREAKRRAEDIAELVSGVTHVENRLKMIHR